MHSFLKFNQVVGNMSSYLGEMVCPFNMEDCDIEAKGLDIDACK